MQRRRLAETFWWQWDIFLLFLFFLGNEDGVVRQDVLLNAVKTLEIARNDPADRVYVVKVEEADAEGASNVLEDLNGVRRCLVLYQLPLVEAVLVYFRFLVSYGQLRLNLPCRLDHLRCKSVDGATARIVALQGVAVWDLS